MTELGEGVSRKDSMWDETSREYEKLLRKFLPATSFDAETARQVVSVGCGQFFEAQALRHFFPNAEITGYELDGMMVNSMNNSNIIPTDRVSLKQGVIGSGVLEQNSADVVVVRNPDVHREVPWGKALQESVDALTQQGRLIITTLTEMEMDQIRPKISGAKILIDTVNKVPGDVWKKGAQDSCVLIASKK